MMSRRKCRHWLSHCIYYLFLTPYI